MSTSAFNYIDLAALVFVVIGAFVGYCRKLSGEIALLLSVGAAFFIGLFFYEHVGVWLVTNTKLDVGGARIATYVFLILSAGIVMVVSRIVLGKIMNLVIGEKADRVGGVLAGSIRSILLVLIFFLAMNIIPYEYLNSKFGEESYIGRGVIRFLPSLEEIIDEKAENLMGDN